MKTETECFRRMYETEMERFRAADPHEYTMHIDRTGVYVRHVNNPKREFTLGVIDANPLEQERIRDHLLQLFYIKPTIRPEIQPVYLRSARRKHDCEDED